MTTVGTGLSGITASSPAMSVASQTGIAAFSVYEGGKYNIYTRRRATTLARGSRWRPVDQRRGDAAAARSQVQRGADVAGDATRRPAGMRSRPTTSNHTTPSSGSKASAQPTIGVGASRFGAAFGGGIRAVVRRHARRSQLVTGVQINSGIANSFSFKDTAAQVGYFNQANRWNWGIVGGQVPYLSGGFQSALGTLGGDARRDR